ncbi:RsmB/NOP family class I SAM-dependent RNA methyltransferase [Mesorhizobium sp. ZMM04-5]|uniref:RsmB/NOP family class I SAM-dependent RNA methyltransferase n=1 Tax=Mesorhizobium marinum TaxID=3228790 RepID=A0ABV3QY83_9HYPH
MTRRPNGTVRKPKPAVASDVPGLPVRMAAAKLLSIVVDARTPLDGLTDNDNGHPHYLALDGRDRALLRAILTTALRFRVTIGKLISKRLERPLPPNASTLTHILHVGAAQILFLDVPDSAAVDLAVTHAKGDPRTARFAALVNGLLRSLARGKESELGPMLDATLDAPPWFADMLVNAYGEPKAHAILAAHRVEAPVDFTVKTDPEGWAGRLGGFVLPTGTVRVEKLQANVSDLPGFAEGDWWVQDAAAALPARLLGDVAGRRVADLCAAPGGKTAQLALAGADVTALDVSRNRLARLVRNLERLRLTATVVQSDLLSYAPDELFDAVLLDAPCSSTGTVRRHPDVPWTKSAEDVAKLAALQAGMIEAAAKLVKPGGRLIFSNCSLDPAEGEQLLRDLPAESGDVSPDPIRPGEIAGVDPFLSEDGTLRTTPADLQLATPGISGLDGFFAARFRRNA